MSMPAGWYDDPFTDHLRRYWNGESWTKETQARPDAIEPTAVTPATMPVTNDNASNDNAANDNVPNYVIPSIVALLCCAWPLAIPALVFAIKANSAKAAGDIPAARLSANRARFWIIVSAALGIVVWIYLSWVIATSDVPTGVPGEQGTLNPFGT